MRVKWFRKGWYAVWTEHGQTQRRSLRTKDYEEALRTFEDFRKQLSLPSETVGDICKAYYEEKKHSAAAPESIKWSLKHIQEELGHLRPDQITRETCREYTKKRNVSNGTIRKELGALKSALRWENPNTPAIIELPRLPKPRDRYLSRQEFRQLVKGAASPHIRLFIVMALYTAGRASAILEMKWSQVNFETGLIDLGKSDGKGRAIVPMHKNLRRCLYRMSKNRTTPYVIEWADKPVKSIKRGFAKARDNAGLGKDVTPHVLRHTAAVWMAESGSSMPEIAAFLGHSDSRITERVYAKYSPQYLSKALKAFD